MFEKAPKAERSRSVIVVNYRSSKLIELERGIEWPHQSAASSLNRSEISVWMRNLLISDGEQWRKLPMVKSDQTKEMKIELFSSTCRQLETSHTNRRICLLRSLSKPSEGSWDFDWNRSGLPIRLISLKDRMACRDAVHRGDRLESAVGSTTVVLLRSTILRAWCMANKRLANIVGRSNNGNGLNPRRWLNLQF